MTTSQALDRIKTITGLAGVRCDESRALANMINAGTFCAGSEHIDLKAMWSAVDLSNVTEVR